MKIIQLTLMTVLFGAIAFLGMCAAAVLFAVLGVWIDSGLSQFLGALDWRFLCLAALALFVGFKVAREVVRP
jgi:hypothetical protein